MLFLRKFGGVGTSHFGAGSAAFSTASGREGLIFDRVSHGLVLPSALTGVLDQLTCSLPEHKNGNCYI